MGAIGALAGVYAVPKVRMAMAESAIEYGEALASRGQWEDAATQFRHALRWNPSSAAAYYGLGVARFGLGDAFGARVAWQKAIALNPAHVRALFDLGNLWRTSGDCGQAVAAYRQALVLAPQLTANRVGLALCYEALGDLAAARRELEGVVVDAPHFLPLLERLRDGRPAVESRKR
jgi:tetratricopeptide (TPR) repeat protein